MYFLRKKSHLKLKNAEKMRNSGHPWRKVELERLWLLDYVFRQIFWWCFRDKNFSGNFFPLLLCFLRYHVCSKLQRERKKSRILHFTIFLRNNLSNQEISTGKKYLLQNSLLKMFLLSIYLFYSKTTQRGCTKNKILHPVHTTPIVFSVTLLWKASLSPLRMDLEESVWEYFS